MVYKHKFCSVVVGLLLASVPQTLQAHATGFSIETTIDEYFLDLGISQEFIIAGQLIDFDVALLNNETQEPDPYENIRVLLQRNDETMMNVNLDEARYGQPRFSYRFVEPGDYELTLVFEKDFEILTKTTLPLYVSAPPSAGISTIQWYQIAVLSLTFLNLLWLIWFFNARRSSPECMVANDRDTDTIPTP